MHGIGPPIVLDKSFAEGVTGPELHRIAENWTFVVPTAFIHEVFTTGPKSRMSTVRGLPSFRHLHLPDLLRHERSNDRPATSWEAHPVNFGDQIGNKDWTATQEVTAACESYDQKGVGCLVELWREVARSRSIPGFENEELLAALRHTDHFTKLCRTLRNHSRVLAVAEAMEPELAHKVDETWITYRRIQAWALNALIIFRSHRSAATLSPKNLEHDTLDIEYLILALHAGALATNESRDSVGKLGWRFKQLRPGGLLADRHGRFTSVS